MRVPERVSEPDTRTMALTDAKIRNTKPRSKPVKLTDGGGLYLEVRPTGSKLWRYRYRIAGRENLFAVGDYPALGLAEARAMRAEARAVAREWMAKKNAGWTPYYAHQVQRVLEADVFPYVGALPIRNVTAAHLLAIVRRVEERGAETVAMMVRQWSSAIFRYAVSTLRADTDPAAALKGAIHRPRTKHAKPLLSNGSQCGPPIGVQS
jgi:hypothetical protein